MEVQMVVVQGKQRGKCLRFHQGDFVFGRGPECQVRPESEWVSRQHCMLRVGQDAAVLRDLGSTNGTLVNGGRVVGERSLQPGDRIQVGPLVLEVVLLDSSAPANSLRDTHVLFKETDEIPDSGTQG